MIKQPDTEEYVENLKWWIAPYGGRHILHTYGRYYKDQHEAIENIKELDDPYLDHV